MKEISPAEIKKTPFELIGKDWMLIAAKKGNKVNAMTASWGGMGVLWGKKVVFIVLRPQRYTKEFIDASHEFTLNFFDEEFRKELTYLGSVSGRNEDKMDRSELNILELNNMPYFAESNLVITCKNLFSTEYKEENFIDKSLIEENYPKKDYHIMYIAEIEKVYEN